MRVTEDLAVSLVLKHCSFNFLSNTDGAKDEVDASDREREHSLSAQCSLTISVSPTVPSQPRGVLSEPHLHLRAGQFPSAAFCAPYVRQCCFPAPWLSESRHSLEELRIKNVTGSCTMVWMKRRCYFKTFENTQTDKTLSEWRYKHR